VAEFETAEELVRQLRPERPVLCARPHVAARAAAWFIEHFPGQTIYALKANTAPQILDALAGAGITRFDVASLPEIEMVAGVPRAQLYFMNPVKARETIARAYFDYSVRAFALDSLDELEKIGSATGNAVDLQLFVRLACPNPHALIPLEGKYGVNEADAPGLLMAARQRAERLGVTFHVGSQAMTPQSFGEALQIAGERICAAGVMIDVLDVGGGFPSRYVGVEPPPLEAFVKSIAETCERLTIGEGVQLMCEPGRALVAEAEAVLVRVEARRGGDLYINDGAFGTLYDGAYSGFTYPARLVRPDGGQPASAKPFRLLGPTCDSVDVMPGPYWLPGCIGEGDYIEIGQVGAYGRVLASGFNGFGAYDQAVLTDEPMVTMYGDAPKRMSDQRSAR
jgi:ornithine decarboxylase